MNSERTDSNWIQTYSGKQYWPTAPRAEDVDIVDVAHHLSLICRYTGATRWFYSVAEHAVRMSLIPMVAAECPLQALLHDAPEAYTGDFARPVKRHIEDMRTLDRRNAAAVGEALGVVLDPLPDVIHWADLVMLATERRDLMAPPPRPWTSTERVEPLRETIEPWTAARAEARFLLRYYELTEKRP